MALKGLNTEGIVKLILIGAVVMLVASQIINFNALTSDDPDAQIFKENVDYEGIVPQTFTWILVAGATFVAWSLFMGFGQRITRKSAISMLLVGLAIYFLYNKVLVASGLLPDLKPLEFTAYQLQAIVSP